MPDVIDTLFPFAADPYVMHHDGWFYATFSTGVNIQLRRARSIAELTDAEPKIIYRARKGTPCSHELAAPELHRLDDSWFVYFTADDGDYDNRRLFVLENHSPDPYEKQFVEKGELITPEYKWSIDGTVFEAARKRYLAWSGWADDRGGRQDLYLARLLDPTVCDERRVLISKPTFDWERHGTPKVNEGPHVIVRDGVVHCLYTASHAGSGQSCIGLLSARVDADLMNAKSWTKHPEPIFAGANGIVSPGQASIVSTGESDWLIYHCAKRPGDRTRYARAQSIAWENGVPVLGEPAAPVDRPPH